LREDQPTPLIKLLAEDLDAHFETLVQAYGNRLYAFALRLTGSPPDAEEIAQDAFVRAYQALRRYEPARIRDLAVRPWLYQIALNVARNRVRGRRLRLVPLESTDEDGDGGLGRPIEPVADERDGPEATVARREQGAELAALVAALPGRYRAAVVLRHVEELSYGEIAAVLGQSVGTVKSNVHRGVRILRDAIERAEVETPALAGERR
jgi:RNA polymerase sigma-70 factor (ECF subfamily)